MKLPESLQHSTKPLVIGWITLLLSCGIAGCSSGSSSVATTSRPYSPEGISLAYTSDSLLNSYDGRPHALLLVIYQLDGLNGFTSLTQDQTGLLSLLSGRVFDKSVMSVERRSIEPGRTDTLIIARPENAEWVGIAAGYNTLDPKLSTRYFKIPVKFKKTGLPVVSKTKGFAEKLELSLIFSPTSIQDAPIINEKKR